MTISDDEIRDELLTELDAREAELPSSVGRRLVDARRTARLQATQPRRRHRWFAWQPIAGAGAVAALALFALVPNLMTPKDSIEMTADDPVVTVDASTADLLGSTDDLEFYQSVDFLLWLEKQG